MSPNLTLRLISLSSRSHFCKFLAVAMHKWGPNLPLIVQVVAGKIETRLRLLQSILVRFQLFMCKIGKDGIYVTLKFEFRAVRSRYRTERRLLFVSRSSMSINHGHPIWDQPQQRSKDMT